MTTRSGLDQAIEDLAEQVITASIEVHRVLGPGLPEVVYQMALARELSRHDIPYKREVIFDVHYKGHHVGTMRADFLIANRLMVELKAIESLAEIHKAQLLSYLKASGIELGLLINFNAPLLMRGVKRVINRLPPAPPNRDQDQPSL